MLRTGIKNTLVHFYIIISNLSNKNIYMYKSGPAMSKWFGKAQAEFYFSEESGQFTKLIFLNLV
jgi:hypothetical protein